MNEGWLGLSGCVVAVGSLVGAELFWMDLVHKAHPLQKRVRQAWLGRSAPLSGWR